MSRYKFERSREFIPGYKFDGGHWRSVAVQAKNGARNLSCYMNFYCGHWSGVGLHFYKGHVIESRKCKNCDELINYTVRVSVVVLALTTQMILRHKAYSRYVAVKVQKFFILSFC